MSAEGRLGRFPALHMLGNKEGDTSTFKPEQRILADFSPQESKNGNREMWLRLAVISSSLNVLTRRRMTAALSWSRLSVLLLPHTPPPLFLIEEGMDELHIC